MEAKLKKVEEDVMVLDDQNNKLNKVSQSTDAGGGGSKSQIDGKSGDNCRLSNTLLWKE